MRLTFECGVFSDCGVPLFRFQSRSVDAGGSSGDDAAGAGRSGERHAGASAALGMERGRVERHLRGGSTAALDPAPRAFDSGRVRAGAAAFDRSVVAEEFSVADEAARAGGSEFDGATCRRAFQFDFGTTGGRDAFEGTRQSPRRRCARCRWSRSRRRRLPVVLSVRSRNHRWPRCVRGCPSSPRRRCVPCRWSRSRRRHPPVVLSVRFRSHRWTRCVRGCPSSPRRRCAPCRWLRSRRHWFAAGVRP